MVPVADNPEYLTVDHELRELMHARAIHSDNQDEIAELTREIRLLIAERNELTRHR